MRKIKRILYANKTQICIIILFLMFSLRVLTWFEYPNILISGDYRPPIIQEAFTNRVTYTWDQTDLGMPSAYTPRILLPSYFLMTIFNTMGINIYTSQMIMIFLMIFFASTLMYFFSKKILSGNVVAAFFAGLYITANIYLVIDREITVINFLDAILVILPCVIMFTEGITKKSYKYIALSGILFPLTYGAFPNYRNSIVCIITIFITSLFYLIKNNKKISCNYKKINFKKIILIKKNNPIIKGLKYIAVFIIVALLASIWIITILWNNADLFTQTYGETGTTSFVYEGINLHDTFRLITKWGFYAKCIIPTNENGVNLVPYANEYLQNPTIITLSYIPTIIAFLAILTPKNRKTTIFFSITALTFLILASGLNPLFGNIYSRIISNIPLMLVFREAAQWSFFVIIAYSILIGITSCCIIEKARKTALKITAATLIITILLASTYPLTIGNVSQNFLESEKTQGAYFPEYYSELNKMLTNDHWSLIIPQRITYFIYEFDETLMNIGNPYPLVFSKPIITGLGTEYMQSNNKELIEKIYEIISEKTHNIATEANATAKTVEDIYKTPNQAIDQNENTRWASKTGMPQWYQLEWNQTQEIKGIEIFFETALAHDYNIQTWNGTNWITQLQIQNNTETKKTHVFNEPVNTTKLRIEYNKATKFDLISMYELEVYTTKGISESLGILGIKNIIVEKKIITGQVFDTNFFSLFSSDTNVIALVKDWEEATVYENKNALEKIYIANTTKTYTTIKDMFNQTKNTPWTTLQHTTYIHTNTTKNTNIPNNLQTPQNLTWQQINPTKYTITTTTNNPFILGFLESYDTKWKATINDNTIPEKDHIQINAYANAWIIKQTGQLTITIEYTPQNTFTTAIIASIILPLLLITTLTIKQIKKVKS